jgi:hypothetical protein
MRNPQQLTYVGRRDPLDWTNTCIEVVLDKAGSGLPMRCVSPLRHRVYHSPTGMEWGYGGSGPSDLARSILWDFLGQEPATSLYQAFKSEVIAALPYERWSLSGAEIAAWLCKEKKP